MKRRRARVRQRLPRLLFTQLGAIRPWCELEADVLHQLGPQLTNGVEEVLPLTEVENSSCTVLLLFSQHFLVTQIRAHKPELGTELRAEARRSAGGASQTQGQNASSSSTGPAGEQKVETMDLFEALDDSALKLFSQAMKPINTLVYGVQDMEAQFSGKPVEKDTNAEKELQKRTRDFAFKHLVAVHMSGEDNSLLQLEDSEGGFHVLPLLSAPFGKAVREALAAGFRTSLSNSSNMANWDELRRVLLEEHRHPQRQAATKELRRRFSGVGERILEVFEVERMAVPSGDWQTPYLPIDRELGFRWVDATGTRHPHLFQGWSRFKCAAHKIPPCELAHMFRPTSDWSIEKSSSTDADGWKYGLAWNSSTWDTKPGLFDAIRKRRWRRTYE